MACFCARAIGAALAFPAQWVPLLRKSAKPQVGSASPEGRIAMHAKNGGRWQKPARYLRSASPGRPFGYRGLLRYLGFWGGEAPASQTDPLATANIGGFYASEGRLGRTAFEGRGG